MFNYKICNLAHYILFDANTTIENLPRQDWRRAQRRHYPHIFNYSQIKFVPPALPPREIRLDKKEDKQTGRHFPGQGRSHLDNFF